MMRLILIIALLFPQGPSKLQLVGVGNKTVAGGKTYTGQSCVGGQAGAGLATATCTASITVSTGDEVIVGGTVGSNIAPSSISCSSGTATITWTVQSGMFLFDSTNGQAGTGGTGKVTAGGTCTPVITWSSALGNLGIVAAGFSGTANTVDGTPASNQNTGSTGTNGNTSGSVTTTSNGDILAGVLVDTAGSAATVTAGTTSVTFTKILCDASSAANLCIEWGTQTTSGSGTQANWTLSNTDRTVASIVAVN